MTSFREDGGSVNMPKQRAWKYSVDIKPLLLDNTLPLVYRARRIAIILLDLPNAEVVLRSLCLRLEYAGRHEDKVQFNLVMNEIYDWADIADVWLGVSPQEVEPS